MAQPKPIVEQITSLVQRQVEEEEDEEALQGKFMSGNLEVQRQMEDEEEEEPIQAKENSGQTPHVTPSLTTQIQSLKSGGQPLPKATRDFFEPRFGVDFSEVRVHTGTNAADSAQSINARAFTMGKNVVFGAGEYAPESIKGKRIISHELMHTIQQTNRVGQLKTSKTKFNIQKTAASCPTSWRTTVNDDHNRALNMIDVARRKLSSYNGTAPPEVKTALDNHFKSSSTGFAGWVNLNLYFLRRMAPLASYDCEDTSSWWCGSRTLAKTFWCVPFIDIRVCEPLYFSQSRNERSATLIHEWVHKYGCNFDLGYSGEPDYPSQWTITALVNADPWSEFVKDVQ